MGKEMSETGKIVAAFFADPRTEEGVMEGAAGAWGVKGCSTCERLVAVHDDLGRAVDTVREECQNDTSSDESFEIADAAIRAIRKAQDEVAAALDKHNEEATVASMR